VNASIPILPSRLIPAKDWNLFHPWPTTGGLRHLIFHAKAKRFENVIVRCGRRILIDESAFFVWARLQDTGFGQGES
jgi:hypothetical protein